MGSGKVGTLSPEDRNAVLATAGRLGLNPYEFGALMHQESGFDPNRWGGAGGQYRGLIQFGPGARSEVGLPSGNMTVAQQMPYVEKYFQQRGYKPGMGIAKAYATVLGGNPNVSLNAKDAFGTSVASSLPGFQKGGSLYTRAQQTLGDVGISSPQTSSSPVNQQTSSSLVNQQTPTPTINNYFITAATPQKQDNPSKASLAETFLSNFKENLMNVPSFDAAGYLSGLYAQQRPNLMEY